MNDGTTWKFAIAWLLAFFASGSATAQDAPKLIAFPGAEGWGASSKGGRGGRVIKVTNLNASGPGSLAEACAADGPRIVVFEVSGVIRGNIRITKPYITIAGQTATGAGVTVEGVISSYARRIPCMAPYRKNAAGDFCNNVIYNCRGGYVDDGHGARAKSPVNLHRKLLPTRAADTGSNIPLCAITADELLR